MELPKIIWFYWNDGLDSAPEIVSICHRSWVEKNPEWQVQVVSDSNYVGFLKPDVPDRCVGMTVQAFSDLLRINLLERYGGVWTDATIFCCTPLDEWLPDVMKSGFFAFRGIVRQHLFLSGFICSEPANYIPRELSRRANAFWVGNQFALRVSKTKARIRRVFSFVLNWHYITTIVWLSRFFCKILRIYPYFWFFYLFNRCVLFDPKFKAVWNATPRIDSEKLHSLKRYGAMNAITDELRNVLMNEPFPMYLLGWRSEDLGERAENRETVVEFLVRHFLDGESTEHV